MNYINLSSIHRLYSFPDYWSMKEAKPKIRRVIMAKDFREVKEIEAKHYVQKYGDYAFRNYLREDKKDLKESGLQSLITALQALYKLNGYPAKYIIIEGRY
ncbi:hypothetical protein K3G39_19855 [Pontibacter sp. HSC-14F20]|uniref:hypothetical protein n=1 Tax=Pontibacter sp. HSC-14F20 TaxID=2864136 RepID=UPI001C72F39E|nr:hypothetical protein [Pontibacter sp. HSC-14F20]MBX0335495.1 hypothetical protein [Pontibacter sp. HSC-14F20]